MPDAEEIVRFLRRFSDLMSTGYNADHLLRAADLIETLVQRVTKAEELLRAEQIKSKNDLDCTKSAYTKFEIETAELKARIADQQWKLNEAVINATKEQQKLLERAEQAETRLASIEADLAEGRVSATHVIVPISTLRLAEAQFEALAAEVSGFVAQVMCEVGASTLDRAIGRSAVEGKVQ
jgi:hypothetical protein